MLAIWTTFNAIYVSFMDNYFIVHMLFVYGNAILKLSYLYEDVF